MTATQNHLDILPFQHVLHGVWQNRTTQTRDGEETLVFFVPVLSAESRNTLKEKNSDQIWNNAKKVRLIIKKSGIRDSGLGLFAAQHFNEGEIITPYLGLQGRQYFDIAPSDDEYLMVNTEGVWVDGNPKRLVPAVNRDGIQFIDPAVTGGPIANNAKFETAWHLDDSGIDSTTTFLEQEMNTTITHNEDPFTLLWDAARQPENNADLSFLLYNDFPQPNPKMEMAESGVLIDVRKGGEFVIEASRDIEPGEEILVDYNQEDMSM